MEELLEGLDCSLRVSGMVGDSIMVGIVNSAMEEAYDRILCSHEGGLECLNDKSRFCGLAIMQLEWCLKYLQEKVDACVVNSDDERERLVGDLRVTRDRIRSRLEETESAIAEKERELADMNQSESELRRALESKDKELRSLRTSLELERARHEGVPEGVVLGEEAGEGMVDESKAALSELRMFIIQHIEDFLSGLTEAKTHISDLVQKLGICYSSTVENSESKLERMEEEGSCAFSDEKIVSEIECKRPSGGTEIQHLEVQPSSEAEILWCKLKTNLDKLFKQLGLEMSILKGRLVLAFETADEAIYLYEAAMDERQLLWTFEKETLCVVMDNFLKDVEESCHSKLLEESGKIPPAFLNISWSSLMKKFAILHHNLEQLTIQLDRQLETGSSVESPAGHLKDIAKEKSTDHLNHFDSKVERNGEPTVWKKTQEVTWPRAVEKGFPFFQRFRELRSMKTKFTEIISKLECFMEESSKIAVAFDDFRSAYEMNRFALQDNLSSESTDKVTVVVHASTAVPRKVSNETTSYSVAADVYEDIRYLKEDRDDPFLKSIILEETNAIFFDVFVRELYMEFIDYKLETLLREDVYRLIFNEIMKERNHEIKTCDFERDTMEEMDQDVFSNLIKVTDNTASLGFKRRAEENISWPSTFFRGPYIGEDIVQIADNLGTSFEIKESLLPYPKSETVEPQMHLVWNPQVAAEQSPSHTETLDDDDDEAFSSARSKLEKALQQLTKNKMQLRELGSDVGQSLEEKECADDNVDETFSSARSKPEMALKQLTKRKTQLRELGSDMGGSLEEKEHADDHDEMFSSVRSKLEKALDPLTNNKMQLGEFGSDVGGSLEEKEIADDEDDEAFSSVRNKLEEVLQQLSRNKMQLRDLGSDMGGSLEEKEHADDGDEMFSSVRSKLEKALQQLTNNKMQLREFGSDVEGSLEEKEIADEEDDEAFSSVRSKLEEVLQQLSRNKMQLRDLGSDMGGSLEEKEHADDYDDDEAFSSVRSKLEMALQQLTRNKMQLRELGSDVGGSLEENESADDDKAFSSVRSKLKKALQQLTKNKMQLRELGSDVGGSLEEKECADDDEAFSSAWSKPEKALQQLSKKLQLRELGPDVGGSLAEKEYTDDDDDDEALFSVRSKLDKALQQLANNKMQPRELGSDVGRSLNKKEFAVDKFEQDKEQKPCLHMMNGGDGCNEIQPVLTELGSYVGGSLEEKECAVDNFDQDKEQTSCIHIKNGEERSKVIQPVLTYLTDFSQDILDLELVVCEKTKASILRLEGLNCRMNLLAQQASSLKKAELLYRKAFIRRCYNLQTAEAEVDLLGDEVDALLGLLEKIYLVLDHYSPVLQYYCGIMDIQNLIKGKLFGDATVQSH